MFVTKVWSRSVLWPIDEDADEDEETGTIDVMRDDKDDDEEEEDEEAGKREDDVEVDSDCKGGPEMGGGEGK